MIDLIVMFKRILIIAVISCGILAFMPAAHAEENTEETSHICPPGYTHSVGINGIDQCIKDGSIIGQYPATVWQEYQQQHGVESEGVAVSYEVYTCQDTEETCESLRRGTTAQIVDKTGHEGGVELYCSQKTSNYKTRQETTRIRYNPDGTPQGALDENGDPVPQPPRDLPQDHYDRYFELCLWGYR